MGKNKLRHFSENATFPNFIQPSIEEVKEGLALRGKWAQKLFGNNHPIVLELGCGKGEYTVELARRYPMKNFIGIDRKGARMWRGARTSVDEGIANAGFLRTRIDFLDRCFGGHEVSEIWITFPDPHINNKNSRLRLTSPFFLAKYHEILANDGLIRLKTDSPELLAFTLNIIAEEGHNLIFQTRDLYASGLDDEATAIQTHYEKIYIKQGHKINYLVFKLNSLPDEGS